MDYTIRDGFAAGKLTGPATGLGVDSLSLVRRLLRVLVVANLCVGAGIVMMLAVSVVAEAWFLRALHMHPAEGHSTLIVAARLVMIVGIAATPLTHVVLTRLQAIVDTVRRGAAFVVENALRLRAVAWAVVGLELLHLAVGMIVYGLPSRGEALDLHWSFSFTRWLSVLLLFVLARVFEEGTELRADAEGTV